MRYNNSNTPWDGLRDFVTRGGIPVTTTLLIINVVLFFAAFFSPQIVAPLLEQTLIFGPHNHLSAPWAFLTYPLYTPGPLTLLIGGVILYITGGSLERSWGSQRFGLLFAVLTSVTAASVLLGSLLFRQPAPLLVGFNLPLSAVIVAFCALNPHQKIILYFFPVQAQLVGWLVVIFTLLQYGPVFGPFACGGMLAAFLYVRYGRSWGQIDSYAFRSPRRRDTGPDLRIYPSKTRFTTRPPTALDGSPTSRAPLDLAGRWRDYQERRRLERLWKNSGGSDPEREAHDDEGRRR